MCIRDRVGIGDLGGGIGESQFAEDEGHERALGEAADDLARRVAQHARLVPLGLKHGAAEVSGLVNRVGVGKEQPTATGMPGCRPDGVGFAGPCWFCARLELWGFDQRDAGKATGDLCGEMCIRDSFFYVPILVMEIQTPLGVEGVNYVGDTLLFAATALLAGFSSADDAV